MTTVRPSFFYLVLAFAISLLLIPISVSAQVAFPTRGGTGTSTVPAYGQVLVGQTNGTYGPIATSSLGLLASISAIYPVEFIANTISLAFGTTSTNTWSAQNTFTSLFATEASSTNATSSNLAVTGAFNFLGTVITDVATWFNGLFDARLATKSTTNLAEGTNLYYTDDRADARITAQKGVALGIASLDGGGKVPVTQLPNSIMEYQGTWNATTNSPTLADGTGSTGDVYRVSVAGTANLGSGSLTFVVGDYAIYNGATWEKADTTDAVSSVNSLTGDITLTTDTITQGSTNLYSQWANGTGGINYAGGSIGIGTSTPNTSLSINKPTSVASQNFVNLLVAGKEVLTLGEDIVGNYGGAVILKDGLGGSGNVALRYNGGYPQFTTTATTFSFTGSGFLTRFTNSYIDFAIGGVTNMTLVGSGHVGIGTSTPYSRLTVWGAGITSATTAFQAVNNASSTILTLRNDQSVLFGTITNPSLTVDSSANMSWSAGTKTFTLPSGSTWTTGTNNNSTIFTYTGTLNTSSSATTTLFRVTPTISQSGSAGYTALLVDATESSVGTGERSLFDARLGGVTRFNVTAGGNVGIGSSSPTKKLVVTVSATNQSAIGDAGGGYSGLWLGQSGMTTTNPIIQQSGNTAYFGLDSGGAYNFGINNANTVVLSSSNFRLAASVIAGWSSDGNAQNPTDTSISRAAAGKLYVNNSNTSNGVGTLVAGSVGIGSTSPYAKLSVKGAGTTSGVNFQTTNSNDTPIITILDSGFVGIGTVSPTTALAVSGTIVGTSYFVSSTGTFRNSSSGVQGSLQFATNGPIFKRDIADDASALTVQQVNAGATGNVLTLMNNVGTTTVFTQGGSLGLATTTPSALLSVQGNGLFSGNLAVASLTATGTISFPGGSISNATLANSTISGVALGGTLGALTATDSTLTFSGSYTGATARTVGLNLANANTWTGLQQFGNASSTRLSVYSGAYFGSTATSTFTSAGWLGIGSSSPFYALSVGGTAYGSIVSAENPIATSTSITVDWSAGNQQNVRVGTAATAIAFTKAIPGATLRLIICNPASTGGAVTFSGVLWPGGTAPTITTTANKCDIVTFLSTIATSTPVIMGGFNQNY